MAEILTPEQRIAELQRAYTQQLVELAVLREQLAEAQAAIRALVIVMQAHPGWQAYPNAVIVLSLPAVQQAMAAEKEAVK